MIIVTGGLGFIGKRLVQSLKKNYDDEIIIVDKKELNLKNYLNNQKFLQKLKNQKFTEKIKIIFHQGANSKTVENNFFSIMKDNYFYTKNLIDICIKKKIPLIYASSASVYGTHTNKFNEENKLEPSNYYSFTKCLVDLYVSRLLKREKYKLIGLRYFNVFGPGEEKKGRMASVFHHFGNQIKQKGLVKLFKGSNGYKNGEQKRDFVFVDDCVDVNIWLFKNFKSGIYNVGSGYATSFNDVARNIFKIKKKKINIKYIEMPSDLIGKYQNFTKANIFKLRKAGYKKKFLNIEQALKFYK